MSYWITEKRCAALKVIIIIVFDIHFLHLQTQKYSKSMNIRPRKDEFAKINAQNIVRIPDSFCEPIIQLTPICRAISGYFVQYFD